MDWLIISGLILFGTFLIIAEVIFVPGTTIVGILGFIFSGYGVYMGYTNYGASTGTLILIAALVVNLIGLISALKSKSWERFSLKNSLTGKYNDDFKIDLKVGDIGMTVSSLKPVGKAVFNDHEIEVRSNGGFIAENVEIEVQRTESSKIFVQPIK